MFWQTNDKSFQKLSINELLIKSNEKLSKKVQTNTNEWAFIKPNEKLLTAEWAFIKYHLKPTQFID